MTSKRHDPPRLVLHGFDPVRWARRYGLELFSAPCRDCGLERTPSVPFVQGELRGLQSSPCSCGNTSRAPYCLVRDPRFGDLFTGGAP